MSTKVKLIKFTDTETIIGDVESYKNPDINQIANEKTPAKHCDLPRHADFERAMDKLKPHLVIATGFAEPFDENGSILTASDFNNFFADKDEAPFVFKGLTVTGIQIIGKHAADGVKIIGTKENANGDVVPFKTGPIALKRVPDGYNYPLVEILDTQIDKLLIEADLYMTRKKHGAGVQTTAEFPEVPKPNPQTRNLKAVKAEQESLVDA